jgi:hypothetical protein
MVLLLQDASQNSRFRCWHPDIAMASHIAFGGALADAGGAFGDARLALATAQR